MNDPIQALLATGVPVGGELAPTSRYRDVGTEAVVEVGVGGADRPILCYRRRLCPQPASDQAAGRPVEAVEPGERLDRIAARRVGDPALWWRIADVNGAIDPLGLVETPDLEPLQPPAGQPPRHVPIPPRRILLIPTGVQDG